MALLSFKRLLEGVQGVFKRQNDGFLATYAYAGFNVKIGTTKEKWSFWHLNGKNSFPLKYDAIVSSNHFFVLRKVVFIASLLRRGRFWEEVTQNYLSLTFSKGGWWNTTFRVCNARIESQPEICRGLLDLDGLDWTVVE